jgi:hypothetical protein
LRERKPMVEASAEGAAPTKGSKKKETTKA